MWSSNRKSKSSPTFDSYEEQEIEGNRGNGENLETVTPDLSFAFTENQESEELGHGDREFDIVNEQHDFGTAYLHERSEIDNDFNDDSSQPISDLQPDEFLQPILKPEELMPGLMKINTVLTEKGYLPLTLMSDDVNAISK